MIELHQRALLRRIQDRLHELPVDLQPLRLQLQQADDRGMAGAEIVDLDVDPERLDPLEVMRRPTSSLSSRKIDSTSSKESSPGRICRPLSDVAERLRHAGAAPKR